MEVIELFFAIAVAGRHQNDAPVDRQSLQFNVETTIVSVCPGDSDGRPGGLLPFAALADSVGDERGLVAHDMVLSLLEAAPNARHRGDQKPERKSEALKGGRWPRAAVRSCTSR